ncbi:MAG: hypothetical protein ACLRPX_12420, partial [Ruthenibacterium sp.]
MFQVFCQNTSSFLAPGRLRLTAAPRRLLPGAMQRMILSSILLIFLAFFKGILYHLGNLLPKKIGYFRYFT